MKTTNMSFQSSASSCTATVSTTPESCNIEADGVPKDVFDGYLLMGQVASPGKLGC